MDNNHKLETTVKSNTEAFYRPVTPSETAVRDDYRYIIGMILFTISTGALAISIIIVVSTFTGVLFSFIFFGNYPMGVLFSNIGLSILSYFGILILVKKLTDSKVLFKTYTISYIVFMTLMMIRVVYFMVM
jgi:hypothetical protein